MTPEALAVRPPHIHVRLSCLNIYTVVLESKSSNSNHIPSLVFFFISSSRLGSWGSHFPSGPRTTYHLHPISHIEIARNPNIYNVSPNPTFTISTFVGFNREYHPPCTWPSKIACLTCSVVYGGPPEAWSLLSTGRLLLIHSEWYLAPLLKSYFYRRHRSPIPRVCWSWNLGLWVPAHYGLVVCALTERSIPYHNMKLSEMSLWGLYKPTYCLHTRSDGQGLAARPWLWRWYRNRNYTFLQMRKTLEHSRTPRALQSNQVILISECTQ